MKQSYFKHVKSLISYKDVQNTSSLPSFIVESEDLACIRNSTWQLNIRSDDGSTGSLYHMSIQRLYAKQS
jgi:hypothetical protein